jgi:prepilin-type processing-associated H-X9-DG protein
LMETQTGPIVLPTYVGISGGCDIAANSPDYQGAAGMTGLVPPRTTREYINLQKGVGHTPGGIITASGMLPPCEHVGLADCTDGSSNTMTVGEQSDWLRDVDPSVSTMYHGDAGWDTSGTGPPNASLIAGGGFISGTVQSMPVPQANAGMPGSPPAAFDCYNIATVRYPPDEKRVLGAAAYPGCNEDHGINNPLQSPHPGGLLVAFADGSVQFISGTTDLAVLLRIAIRNDGQNVLVD